jgi:hypothetical protein
MLSTSQKSERGENTMFRWLISERPTQPHNPDSMQKACDDVKDSIANGDIGDIVAAHEKLILKYYDDVLTQANQSFFSARTVAALGFWLLAITLAYALIFDALNRFNLGAPSAATTSMTIEKIGLVSGALIEFIAGVNFWLYARGARQFSAFHICLERTHRYLIAYKVIKEVQTDRDCALRDLACIMANAPMIGAMETDNGAGARTAQRTAQVAAVSAQLTPA